MLHATFKRLLSLTSFLALAIFVFALHASAVKPIVPPGGNNNKREAQSNVNTFDKPDFAFPQTVIGNARALLTSGSDVQRLRAAIQLTIANDLISNSNAPDMARMLDSLRLAMKAPWSNLAALLEAKLYTDIYSQAPYKYRNRKLPTDSFPANPADWSKDLFRIKVESLVDIAAADLKGLNDIPFSEITPLLKNVHDYGYSVASFVGHESIDLLDNFSERGTNTLPFAAKTSAPPATEDKKLAIVGRMVDLFRKEGGIDYVRAVILKSSMLNDDVANKYLLDTYYEMNDVYAPALLLARYSSGSEDDTKKEYALLSEALTRYPSSPYANNLKNRLSRISQPSANVSLESQYLKGAPIIATVSADNLNKVYLTVYSVPDNSQNVRWTDLKDKGKKLQSTSVAIKGEIPFFSGNIIVNLPPLDYGRYACVVSESVEPSMADFDNLSTFIVSDLAFSTSVDNYNPSSSGVYVVNGANFAPLKDVEVKFMRYGSVNKKAVTNGEGFANGGDSSGEAVATLGKDRNEIWYSANARKRDNSRTYGAKILTDLSIYKPGGNVGFVGAAYSIAEKKARPEKMGLNVYLVDINSQHLDTLRLESDEQGRFSGNFTLPSKGAPGNWRIYAERIDGVFLSNVNFQVDEYRSPTFFVEPGEIKGELQAGHPVVIEGRVMTYSGMPLADAQVKYNITYNTWWRMCDSDAIFGGETVTDSQGRYSITLDTKQCVGTPYAVGNYNLNITATSPTGETAAAPSSRFSLGSEIRLSPYIPSRVELSADNKTVDFDVRVVDLLDESVDDIPVDYELKDAAGKVCASGRCRSPKLCLESSLIKPGKYLLSLLLPDSSEPQSSSFEFVAFDPKSDIVPCDTALWLVSSSYKAKSSKVDVEVGSSYTDGFILCEISNSSRVIERKWLKATGKIEKVAVDAPAEDDRLWVTFTAMRDLRPVSSSVSVFPIGIDDRPRIESVSFRNKITPGAAEHWSFRITDGNLSPAGMPVMAVMTDKAINAVAPFSWDLNPAGRIFFQNPLATNVSRLSEVSNSSRFGLVENLKNFSPDYPAWNFYGYSLFDSDNYRSNRVYYSACKTSARGAYKMDNVDAGAIVENLCEEAAIDTAFAGAADDSAGTTTQMEYSEAECPIAFFKPNLSAGPDGIVDINFDVPNFNTTWQFQIATYDDRMYGTSLTYYSLSSKPVMVKANVPRFLRTGDSTTLLATVSNNTDELSNVEARIELFDPSSDAVLAAKDFKSLQIEPKATTIVGLDYIVPDTITLVGLRVYAISGNHTDGEQTLISILPSSSPIVESTPFYLGLGSGTASFSLPNYSADSSVTLQYCDNPVWYCVTALPELSSGDSKSLLTKSAALFGNALAAGLTRKYPQIRTALSYWDEALKQGADSTLVSNLDKDASLKIIDLEETNWLRNAATESLRMRSLVGLLDTKKVDGVIKSLSDEIVNLQHKDGGWSWTDGFESSTFITSRILLDLAMLKQMDCCPASDPLDKAAERAVSFVDKKIYEEYVKNDKKIFTRAALKWLYIRSFFPDESNVSGFDNYRKKAIAQIADEWRDFDIYNKATAAILLARSGCVADAETILESLRQFATVSPARGTYFDNLRSGWDGFGRLITTTQVLEAFSFVRPDDKMVDGLRQWLVLQRQVEDWGFSRYTSEIVYAILTSGSDWTSDSAEAVLRLGDSEIRRSARDLFTGSFSMSLDPREASGKTLSITKSGNGPAWGGVISQFVAPTNEVKAVAIDDLSVTKEIFVLETTDAGTSARRADSLEKGAKVRVSITINNKRDLQYVAVTDERAACLQPADQLSSYEVSDGVWMYREVRNSETDLLIAFLPKGNHVITYDCYVDRSGVFSAGVASAQSLYAPLITAHSAGLVLNVK